MVVLILLTAIMLANIVPTIAGSLVAKAFGVGVPKVSLGVWGPRIVSRMGHSLLVVSPWQFASSFSYKHQSTLDLYPDTPGKFIDDLHPIIRSLIALSGPLILLAFTFPILWGQAVSSFAAGFSQILLGALSPLSYAQDLVSNFARLVADRPLAASAVLITKIVSFSLLPLSPNPGGSAVIELARWRRTAIPTWLSTVQQIGLVAVLAIIVSWFVAIIVFLGRGSAI